MMALLEILSAIFCPQFTFNKAFNAKETFKDLDGQEHYTWRAVRRQNINELIPDIFHIILYLTVALVTGSDQQQMDPKNIAKNQAADVKVNYGIVYHIGTYAAWAFVLVVVVVVGVLWYPIFKWLDTPSSEEIATDSDITPARDTFYYLRIMNKYMYTSFAYVRLCMFASHLYTTVTQVDSKPVSISAAAGRNIDLREARKARVSLVFGMFLSLILGAGVMRFWFEQGLVHTTVQEYAIIIVPIQLTIGVTFASIFQAWFEKHGDLPPFEKDVDGKLTMEGVQQSLCYLVKSETDPAILAKLAVVLRKDEDEKDTR